MSYDVGSNIRSVLSLTNDEAKTFFLKKESYCNFDLPKYINFEPVLSNVNRFITGLDYEQQKNIGFNFVKAKNVENVNYLLLNNKDGKFAWRPFELIHPALYVALVHKIFSFPRSGVGMHTGVE